MLYANITTPGGPEVLEIKSGEKPVPKPHEVLIQVAFAGVNGPDIAQRSGSYPPPPGASLILGLEVSGVISAIGSEVTNLKVGDKVCALTPGGGYAEYCVTPAVHCLKVPDGISLKEAAGIPETFFTVWSNVFDRGGLKAGEVFLIHGGTSGIGVAAIQLAKSFGATVICTVGSEDKVQASKRLGVDLAINYKTLDFVQEVKSFTNNRGADLILDMVGGEYFNRNIDSLALEGRLVQIATREGAEVSLNLFKMMLKRIHITGSTLRAQSIEQKGRIATALEKNVWPLFASRSVQVVIDKVFDFKDVQNAHRSMEGSHIGKIILSINPDL